MFRSYIWISAFPKICFLFVLLQMIGCAPTVYQYTVDSKPSRATLYGGFSESHMGVYGATPFVYQSTGRLPRYFQAKKEGYKDSDIYHQPVLGPAGLKNIFINLEPAVTRDALMPYKKRNTLTGYYEFLSKYPDSSLKEEVFGLMVSLISTSSTRNSEYKQLLESYPESLAVLPESVRINYIGPKGMKIVDLRRLLKQGIGSAILQQKILSAGQPYAEFSFAEIKRLTAMGFSDQLVASMLQVTQQHKVKQQKKTQAKAVAVSSRRRAATRAAPAAAPQAPGVGDKLADCALMLAKKKACDQIGGFGGMACMALLPGGHNCF